MSLSQALNQFAQNLGRYPTLLPVDHFLSYSCIKNQSKEELRNDRKRMHRI